MPNPLFYAFLFIFGACFGSFLNVVIFRYKPENFSIKNLFGRSRCSHCHKTLRFYELFPILSFFAQAGKCRSCRARLSWQYPLVELLAGLVFVLVPLHFFDLPMIYAFPAIEAIILSVIWVVAFLVLILISAIDLRFQIIPDFLNGLLALLGIAGIFTLRYFSDFGIANNGIHGSFLGRYAMIFRVGDSLWVNFILGAVFGLILFGGLHLLTRGRGMGLGDAKLAAALGLLLGWPDIVLVSALAFIVGSIVSIFLLVKKKKKAKDQLPFGPFLAVGTALVFFFGYEIVNAYFSLFNL